MLLRNHITALLIAFLGMQWGNAVAEPGGSAGLQTGLYTGAGFESYHYNDRGKVMQSFATGFNRGRTCTYYNYDGSLREVVTEYPDSAFRGGTASYTYNRTGQLTKIKYESETCGFIGIPLDPGIAMPLASGATAGSKAAADTASVIIGYNGRLYQDSHRLISDVSYDNDGNRTLTYVERGTVNEYYDGEGNHLKTVYEENGKPAVTKEYTGAGHVIRSLFQSGECLLDASHRLDYVLFGSGIAQAYVPRCGECGSIHSSHICLLEEI